jgi:hypothetical protein
MAGSLALLSFDAARGHGIKRSNLRGVIREEGGVDPGPWFFQPDPQKPFFVPAKAEKLVRRAARQYFMVGKKPDGSPVEVRLTAGSFHMEGFF